MSALADRAASKTITEINVHLSRFVILEYFKVSIQQFIETTMNSLMENEKEEKTEEKQQGGI